VGGEVGVKPDLRQERGGSAIGFGMEGSEKRGIGEWKKNNVPIFVSGSEEESYVLKLLQVSDIAPVTPVSMII